MHFLYLTFFLGSLQSEIESINQIQILEKKIEETNKSKEFLESELNEFRNDIILLSDEINILSKKIKNINSQNVIENHFEELAVDKNSSENLNKLILKNFEKFKVGLEIMLKQNKELKEKESKYFSQKEDNDLTLKFEKTVLVNNMVDELNNQLIHWGRELKFSAFNYLTENSDQPQQSTDSNVKQTLTSDNVIL